MKRHDNWNLDSTSQDITFFGNMTTYILIIALCVTPIGFGVVLYLLADKAFNSSNKIIKDLIIENNYLRKDITHLAGKEARTLLPSEAREIEEMERAEKKAENPDLIPLDQALSLGMLDPENPKPRIKDSKKLST